MGAVAAAVFAALKIPAIVFFLCFVQPVQFISADGDGPFFFFFLEITGL